MHVIGSYPLTNYTIMINKIVGNFSSWYAILMSRRPYEDGAERTIDGERFKVVHGGGFLHDVMIAEC